MDTGKQHNETIKEMYDAHPMVTRMLVQSILMNNSLYKCVDSELQPHFSVFISEVLALAYHLNLTSTDVDKLNVAVSDDTYGFKILEGEHKGVYNILHIDMAKTIAAKLFKMQPYSNIQEMVDNFNKYTVGDFKLCNSINDYTCLICKDV